MKSSKVVKSNPLNRLGRLSVITMMALSISVGTVRAAEEFKLWHESAVGSTEPGKLLVHLGDDDKDKAVKQILDGSVESLEKFVKENASEPFKFVEGLKEARAKAEKDGKFDEKFVRDLEGKLFGSTAKVAAKTFGGEEKQAAYRKLFQTLMGLEKVGDDFLSKVFNKKSLLADLDITDKKPVKKDDDETKKKEEEAKRKAAEEAARKAAEEAARKAAEEANRRNTGTGEVIDDAALQRQAQGICDKFNSLRDEQLKTLKDQINPLKDALNETFNKLAGLSQPAIDPNQIAQKRNEKGLDDILPGLLANALNNDKQQDVTPSSNNQQPFFPQQQRKNDKEDPSQLNQPVPDVPQQQQQSGGLPMMPYQSQAATGPIHLNLPSASGRQELRDAQDALSAIQMRTPVAASLGMNAGLPELVMAKVKVRGEIQKAQGALLAAKERASRLDEQLEELKDASLPPEAKRKMTALEQDLNGKKAQMQQQQQMLQMLAPEQRGEAQQMMYMQQQQVQQAEQALNAYRAEMDIASERMNSEVKKLSKIRDNLQSTASKLEGELGGLKEEEASVQQLINTNMQMQMAQMQPQQGSGTPNINRLQGFSGGNNAPRTTAPRLGTALQSGAAGATEMRGSLGAQK